MGKYKISKKAIADLNNIWNYTADVWSEEQADKYYNLLYTCIKGLSVFPDYLRKGYDVIKPGLFGYHVGHHIIFYKKKRNGIIWIDRILHEKMDFKRHLSLNCPK